MLQYMSVNLITDNIRAEWVRREGPVCLQLMEGT